MPLAPRRAPPHLLRREDDAEPPWLTARLVHLGQHQPDRRRPERSRQGEERQPDDQSTASNRRLHGRQPVTRAGSALREPILSDPGTIPVSWLTNSWHYSRPRTAPGLERSVEHHRLFHRSAGFS